MNAILPKMGCSLKTCRHVVFGPRKCSGIGALDFATERGVQQTLLLLKHIRNNYDLSTLSGLDLNGSSYTQALPDRFLKAQILRSHVWKLDGSEHCRTSFAWSMPRDIWKWDACPNFPSEQSCTDGSIPCAPTMHLERPVPIEPLLSAPRRQIPLQNLQPRRRQHASGNLARTTST
jgi:hypothetical protein